MRTAASLALLLVVASPALAKVELSLPLEGYFRPGRYMPVRFTTDAPILISGTGLVPTRIEAASGHAEGIAPLLALEAAARTVQWRTKAGLSGDVQPFLRALEPQQKLVGLIGGTDAAARELFPGTTVIAVRLERGSLLTGQPAAWSSLDALALDTTELTAIGPARLQELVATGIAVIVPAGGDKPSAPWRQVSGHWVLHRQALGPKVAGVNPGAYIAVGGWQADWPKPFRVRVIIYGLLVAIAMLGTALIARRWAGAAGLLVAIICVAALGFWWRGRTAVLQRAGQIVVTDGAGRQTDSWRYFASAQRARATLPWSGPTWPIFEDQVQREAMWLGLICDGQGMAKAFEFGLAPGGRAAFLTRTIAFASATSDRAIQPPPDDPLVRLARRVYLRRQDRLIGQIAPPPAAQQTVEQWGTLLIETQ